MNNKIAEIYRTDHYEKFKRLEGNRKVNDVRVGKIIKSIKTRGYILSPIAINEKWEVIDGQGRLKALKLLDLPVDYYFVKGAGIDECIAMNIYGTNWSVVDYIDSYAEVGNVDYQRLQHLMNVYKEFGLAVIYNAISGKLGTGSNVIKEGSLKCSDDDFNYSIKVLEYEKKFEPFLKSVGSVNNYYSAIGFCYRHDEVDRESLLAKVETYQADLIPAQKFEQALAVIEEIYNTRQRRKVYLVTDYKRLKNAEKRR